MLLTTAKLPLDVEESNESLEDIKQAAKQTAGQPCNPPNSLTSFLHKVRLKRIESEVQHLIYRVDRPVASSNELTEDFLTQLQAWKKLIPGGTNGYESSIQHPVDNLETYVQHSFCKLIING